MVITNNKSYLYNLSILILLFIYISITGSIYLELSDYLVYLTCEIIVFFSFWILIKTLLLKDYKNKLFGLIISWYIVFGYHLKPVVMFDNFNLVFGLKSFSFNQYVDSYLEILPSISFQSILIFSMLYIVSNLTKNIKFDFNKIVNINLRNVFILIVFSLVLKLIVHYYLGMGIPGIEPSTKIPIFGGLITFYSRFSLFAILNFYLLYSIMMNSKLHLITSFFSIILFILIDMSIASKYSMFYQVFLFIIIYFITRKKYSIPKSYIIVLIIFTIILLITYKYINFYRFALINGYDMFDAINIALNSQEAKKESFLLSIFDRITGIEKIIFIEQFSDKINFISLSSFFSDSFTNSFTTLVSGVQNKNNAISATQMGFMYLFSTISLENNILVVLLYIIIFSIFCLFLIIVKIKIFISEEYYLITALLGIFAIYLFFGSGNIIFFVKEMTVLLFSIILLFKISKKKYD